MRWAPWCCWHGCAGCSRWRGCPPGLEEACGILRSLLYLSLFAGWGISLYNRTVHPQVRRLLLNVDLLMLFWILVRTLRFQLNTPPGMDRMLWYLYYAPMLGIPVLCVQLVLTVDRSERYRLSAWARMLWLPSAVLLELVLTNDLHQQVFRLQQPWNEKYQYGWLFGLVVGWIVICILLAFGITAHKSRNPRILRRLPLPAIPMVLLGIYAVLYSLHIPLIRQFLGDMTIVHCLMTAASLEGGLRCGLIQSNTGYEELLRVTSLAVQLVDRQGNVYCCSEKGRMVDRRELQAAMHGTVQLDEHTLLRSAPGAGRLCDVADRHHRAGGKHGAPEGEPHGAGRAQLSGTAELRGGAQDQRPAGEEPPVRSAAAPAGPPRSSGWISF